MGLLNEEEVLNKLSVKNFYNLSKDKIDQLVPILGKIDPNTVQKILAHSPSLLNASVEFGKKALDSNDKSAGDAQTIIKTNLDILGNYLERNNLSLEELKYVGDKMTELAKISMQIHQGNQSFWKEMFCIAGSIIVGICYVFSDSKDNS
ncbi:MAG: hypothetical protein Q4F00_05445 [bacterium]|nr:hypothetical protein [bacterium]